MPVRPAVALRRLAVALCLVVVGSLATSAPALAAAPRANIVVTYVGFPVAARTAFEYAVTRWEAMLTSPVAIKVKAEWTPLPGTYALGHAGPKAVTGPPAPLRSDRFYPLALANALTGKDLKVVYPGYGFDYDIEGEFNSALPNWYFGTDADPPATKIDFVSVVMHELGHGLGVGGWLRKAGLKGGYDGPYPGVYDNFPEAASGKRLLSYPDESTGMGSQLTSNALYWGGRRGEAYNGGVRPRLYAPAVFVRGTSYSHLNESTYRATNRNALMTPSTSPGEAHHTPGPVVLGMLRDMGWRLGPAGEALVAKLTLQSIGVSDASIAEGTTITVRGRLTRAEGGAAVAGEKVHLYRRLVGSAVWRYVSTKTTSALGSVSFAAAPRADVRYQLRHPSSPSADADSSPVRTINVS